jgi:hypothetical protein
MGTVNHEQANLLLKLYELRREPRLRQARAWYFANFHPTSVEDVAKKFPPGSEENTNVRMVVSYWEMAVNMANRGLIDEEFFFENTGEQWVIWDRLRPIVGEWRAAFKNPHMFKNLEDHCKRFEEWREKRAPGSNAVLRQMLEQMARGQAQAQAKAAND